MTESQKVYYRRFVKFAVDCAKLIAKLDWKIPGNREWGKQLIRSSGSPSADYIEAIEASSDSEFIYKYKLARRESNESVHWLFLLKLTNHKKHHQEMDRLMREGREFVKIFTTSIETKKKNIAKNKKMTDER